MTIVSERYGWAHDNWLGSSRQHNGWDDDGFRFFAQKRVLRWLGEPRVQLKLDASERRALERLCQRLPEMLPPQPACLTHGDFLPLLHLRQLMALIAMYDHDWASTEAVRALVAPFRTR